MKILITIEVPAITSQFDAWLPTSLKIKELAPLITKAVEELSEHTYVSSGAEVICYKEGGITLQPQYTLLHYEISTGDHLMVL